MMAHVTVPLASQKYGSCRPTNPTQLKNTHELGSGRSQKLRLNGARFESVLRSGTDLMDSSEPNSISRSVAPLSTRQPGRFDLVVVLNL